MKNQVIRSIINNTFLPNYDVINDYFRENDLTYNGECKIDGGFTLDFCSSDDKQTFEKNLKTQPEDWYYRTHPVKYTLNSSGYRTKEFDDIDWKESILVFGCSFVYGVGVTDEHTIPYFLEQLSGRPVINMGIGGSSIQTVLHNSIILNDSKYPTPKAVVNMWPDPFRHLLYRSDSTFNVGKWNSDLKLNQEFSSKQNITPFNLMNIKMVRNLWKNKTIHYECIFQRKAKTLIDKLDDKVDCQFLACWPATRMEGARDTLHNDAKKNLEIAKKIYEKIKPQLKN